MNRFDWGETSADRFDPITLEVIRHRPRLSELVFCRPDGGPVKDLRKTWSWACKRANVPRVRSREINGTEQMDLHPSATNRRKTGDG